jgi:hypothetical protein
MITWFKKTELQNMRFRFFLTSMATPVKKTSIGVSNCIKKDSNLD